MTIPEEHQAAQGARKRPAAARGAVLPRDPDWEYVAQSIGAINSAVARLGLDLAVPLPSGDGRDRDRVSTRLMLVLRETHDRAVFELLYLLNARLLHTFCLARLRKAHPQLDAAELVDEAFLRIFLKCDTFRRTERSTFTGWALVILENIVRRQLQVLRRTGTRPLPDADELVDTAADPLVGALRNEARQAAVETWPTIVRLCAAGLLRLPPRWRRALELREGEDLPYGEIAARMNVTRGHVGMMIRRARRRILDQVREALAPYDVNNDD